MIVIRAIVGNAANTLLEEEENSVMRQNKVQMVTVVVAFVVMLFGAGAVCAQTTSFT